MDFAALPPEINSARMYSGPGIDSMLIAASTWQDLSADLYATASAVQSVVQSLTTGPWLGSAANSMAAAALPYAAWIERTAEHAAMTSRQAEAAATAYETAFAMTVPPPLVVENRIRLAVLTATNILGQNTPAIALTEAEYGEMWAQDAAAMYGYASASAAATAELPAFDAAPRVTNESGRARQAAALTQAGEATAVDRALSIVSEHLQLPATTAETLNAAAPAELAQGLPSTSELTGMASARVSDAAAIMSSVLPLLAGQGGQAAEEPAPLAQSVADAENRSATQSLANGANVSRGAADSVGRLSVPPSWAQANHTATPAASSQPVGSPAAPSVDATPHLLGGTPLAGLANAAHRAGVSNILQVAPRAYSMPRMPAAG